MDIEEAIRTRVSIKDFTARPVAREEIERLLEAAILAPNHRMTQPLEFRVMGEGAKRAYAEALAGRKTAKIDDAGTAAAVREKVLRGHLGVPAMIGVVVAVDENPEIREEDYATAFMAIQNLSLAAIEIGLGTHIKTGAVLEEPALRDALEIGDGQRLAAVVFLGQPAGVPQSKPRTPADEKTRWLE